MAIRIGCAGWTLRKEYFAAFPQLGSHLQRYASRFNCVEINSSFYRSHRVSTYRRWAEETPSDFRFAVKLPKQITHTNRLRDSQQEVMQFAAEVNGLGAKLGALLVQLPPSLVFECDVALHFIEQLKEARLLCPVVMEPRHLSWFDKEVDSILVGQGVGRVAADPAVAPAAREPVSANGLVYYRWHGSPRIYYSSYDDLTLVDLAQRLNTYAKASEDVWCIFDNTAEGAATENALKMLESVKTA